MTISGVNDTLNALAFGLSTGKGRDHNDRRDDDNDDDRFTHAGSNGRQPGRSSLAASLEGEPDDLVIL